MTPTDILKTYWGYPGFRPLQEDIVRSVLAGKDSLAILPTGGGKSLCFQVPALILDGPCIVITPLIALMRDQVQQLQNRKISAVALHSGLSYQEVREILKDIVRGKYKFLYLSPERISTNVFSEALPYLKPSLIAIDEAHCISQWGYDFRPSYLRVSSIREVYPNVPMLALTASATPEVQKDILQQLKMREPACFRQSFERPNLSYSAFRVDSRITRLREIIKSVQGSVIVYCKTRKRTTEITAILQEEGISAAFYHAGLPQAERIIRQDQWVQNQIRVMVCTNAFGMGIDKPDVRLVVHLAPPDCLENYYQEAGRAGRDGQKAYAVLLYHAKDLDELRAYPDTRFPPMPVIRKVYEAMGNYLQLPTGLGQDSNFDMDIQDFIRKFRLTLPEVIHVMQALQQGGVLSFQEQMFQPSTVQVTASRQDLDHAGSLEAGLGELLKTLLRSYEGLLDHPASISEKNLAWQLKSSMDQISRQLTQLHKIGMVTYKPARETPQVRFLQNRVIAADLYIDPKAYMQRKSIFQKRVDTMIRYMLPGIECRATFIGAYFGDETMKPCGICDQCLNRRKKGLDAQTYKQMEEKAIQFLQGEALYTADLMAKLEPVRRDLFWEMVADWEAEKRIITEKDGRIRLK